MLEGRRDAVEKFGKLRSVVFRNFLLNSGECMLKKESAEKAISWMSRNGYAYTDYAQLKPSLQTFKNGGQYGVEIPVINSLKVLEQTVRAIEDTGICVTRFNETHGSFLLSDSELLEMLRVCREQNFGIVIGLGPRPEYDIKGSFYRSEFGLEMGRRNNNLDAVKQCVEEAIRLAELGCRGITVYDEGVLKVLAEMRAQGYLPRNLKLKTSTHMMCANPWIGSIFHENGADSVTTAHDLGLPVIQELRKLNPGLVLDVPTDVYKTKGGFI
ncbi:MAG: hypothetical protein ACI86C_001694, partial [Candidatus Latescibacterota bacterium]